MNLRLGHILVDGGAVLAVPVPGQYKARPPVPSPVEGLPPLHRGLIPVDFIPHFTFAVASFADALYLMNFSAQSPFRLCLGSKADFPSVAVVVVEIVREKSALLRQFDSSVSASAESQRPQGLSLATVLTLEYTKFCCKLETCLVGSCVRRCVFSLCLLHAAAVAFMSFCSLSFDLSLSCAICGHPALSLVLLDFLSWHSFNSVICASHLQHQEISGCTPFHFDLCFLCACLHHCEPRVLRAFDGSVSVSALAMWPAHL